ncbi:tubulin binding cofactor C-domain-containing protein [Pelagophyceae sp. CCMP2097]|nr:tubulin binding cofactor C-domain-containing protein [Pelagophyceae sp. CCMP2097]
MADAKQFVASDGTVFTKARLLRQYEFDKKFSFKNKKGETLTKVAGEVDGSNFEMADLEGCEASLCDLTDMVTIDECVSCKIFVGCGRESVFVRDCKDCVLYLCCKQLRTRDCHNCTFYLYSQTEPIIETSSGIAFAPFCGGFPNQKELMKVGNLDPQCNLWWGVFDFNDAQKTGKNWRYLAVDERAEAWFPSGDCEDCISKPEPGSFSALPSQNGGNFAPPPTAAGEAAPMMSFAFDTSQDAAEQAHLAAEASLAPLPVAPTQFLAPDALVFDAQLLTPPAPAETAMPPPPPM